MTSEELKMHLLLLKENARGIEDTIIQNVKKESFVWITDELIKALEQQPSDDCISRAEALRHRHLIHDDDGIGYSVVRVDEIIDLPSVIPQPKIGHWEYVQYDNNPNIGNWHCSECRTIIPHMPVETDRTPIYKWCPMCGAKMEVEE